MIWIKESVINMLVVFISILLVLIALNTAFKAFAPHIVNQKFLPRALIGYLGDHYKTFYPSVNDKSFKNWVAVLGDSCAAGQGDAYLNNDELYGAFHFLNQKNNHNYYIFARSGFGSISSVREYLLTLSEFKDGFFYQRVEKPDKILFLFYEGNDLNNNVEHYRRAKREQSVKDFVEQEIEKTPPFKRYKENYLPIFDLISPKVFRNVFLGNVLGQSEQNEPAPPGENKIVLSSGVVDYASLPQSAAMELESKELNTALQVLFESLTYLRKQSEHIQIEIVYIPSVVTAYTWQNPVKIQTYQNNQGFFVDQEQNLERSRYIRNKLKEFSESNDLIFVDTTETITKQGKQQILHGIKDPKHFNAAGYKLLSELING